jgi:NADH dehydrogenase [ubiquinone] 1 alpha subcomplex assembly factor 6
MSQDEAQYCAEQVRRLDRDRWLCILLAPDGSQRDLLALTAFNLEIARIREVIREPHMGLIRLQWWRDAVSEARAGKPRKHPVCLEVARLLADAIVNETDLIALIDAREKDIDDTPCADMADLNAYADATSGALAILAARLCGARREAEIAAAGALGRGWAMTGILRAAPFHAGARRCFLPTQQLLRQGVSLESWFSGRPEPGARLVVGEVAAAAETALAGVRRGDLPRAAYAVAGLRVLARAHLRRIARAGHDAFAPALQDPMPMAAARLTLARALGSW